MLERHSEHMVFTVETSGLWNSCTEHCPNFLWELRIFSKRHAYPKMPFFRFFSGENSSCDTTSRRDGTGREGTTTVSTISFSSLVKITQFSGFRGGKP